MSARPVVVVLAAWFVSLAAGCARPDGDDTPEPPPPSSKLIVRLAANQIQWTDAGGTAPAVTAVVISADGSEEDVTASAAYTTSPADLASVTNATLVPTGATAGRGLVTATFGGLVGEEGFEVFVERNVGGTAPAGTDALFGTATLDPSTTLAIAYPPAGALVPPNLGEMEVHWRDATGKDVYEVTLAAKYVTVKAYVATLGAATFHTLAADHWKLLSSGARGVDLTVRVRGLASASPASYIQGEQTLRIAAEEVRGGVYYWNTTRAAIMRFDMSAQATPPERFYPAPGQTGCVGCHAVSRDGTVVAVRREGSNMNYGNALQVETLTTMLSDTAQQWNFSAVHPNNTDLFTTTENGLWRTDLTTGVASPLHTTSRIAQPDVSANGGSIVATEVLAGSEVWTSSGRLVVFDYDQVTKAVSAPRTLVDPNAGAYPYYPSFSPDNTWVLFNRAVGGSSYDNPNAELWVTKADGTGTPLRLIEAEVAATYNSWPKWTPFVTHEPTMNGGTETVLWFTVASRRGFGVRSANNAQAPQLWLAPFFPDRAANGQPSSAPAVRLPFQSLAEGNHIAQWTEEIVTIQ